MLYKDYYFACAIYNVVSSKTKHICSAITNKLNRLAPRYKCNYCYFRDNVVY